MSSFIGFPKRLAVASVVFTALALAACNNSQTGTGGEAQTGGSPSPAASGEQVSGPVAVDGSRTVSPISQAVAEEFQGANSHRLASTLRPGLELLAGVPTVVYGYFALTYVTPLLRNFIPLDVFNALSAGLVMGIMIIPTVGSISLDSLRAVPSSLREAAYGLGATKMEVTTQVVFPAALSGIAASIILGISRAVGETMIVVIAAGQQPRLTLNPAEQVAAMTAYIAQVAAGDTPRGTIGYKTLFAVGSTLFLITLLLNIISYLIAQRFREVYD